MRFRRILIFILYYTMIFSLFAEDEYEHLKASDIIYTNTYKPFSGSGSYSYDYYLEADNIIKHISGSDTIHIETRTRHSSVSGMYMEIAEKINRYKGKIFYTSNLKLIVKETISYSTTSDEDDIDDDISYDEYSVSVDDLLYDTNDNITTIDIDHTDTRGEKITFKGRILADTRGPTMGIDFLELYNNTISDENLYKDYQYITDETYQNIDSLDSVSMYVNPDIESFSIDFINNSAVDYANIIAEDDSILGSSINYFTMYLSKSLGEDEELVYNGDIEFQGSLSLATYNFITSLLKNNDNYITVNYVMEAEDNLGNSHSSELIVIPDVSEPDYTKQPTTYTLSTNVNESTFTVTIPFIDVADSESGLNIKGPLKSYINGYNQTYIVDVAFSTFKVDTVLTEEEYNSLSDEEKNNIEIADEATDDYEIISDQLNDTGNYNSYINIFARDKDYTITSIIEDNVSNTTPIIETPIMLSAKPVIDDGGINQDKKPYIYYDESNIFLNGRIDLGELATEGISNIELYIVDITGTTPTKVESFIYDVGDIIDDTDRSSSNGKELPFDINISEYVQSNNTYELKLLTTHNVGVTEDSFYEITVPNLIPLAQTNITLSKSSEISTTIELSHDSNISPYLEEYEIGDENSNFPDIQSIDYVSTSLESSLELNYIGSDVNDETSNITTRYEEDNGYYYLLFDYVYDLDDDTDNGINIDTYLYTGHKFKVDEGITLVEPTLNIDNTVINSNNLTVSLDIGGSEDISGFTEFHVFATETSVTEISDDTVKSAEFEIENTVSEELTGIFDVSNSTKDYRLWLKVQDAAGYVTYESMNVITVDMVAPDELESEDFTDGYGYSKDDNDITLSFQTNLEALGAVSYRWKTNKITTFSDFTDSSVIRILFPQSDFHELYNEQIDLTVELLDVAGNTQESTISNFYTPSRIVSEDDIEDTHSYEGSNKIVFSSVNNSEYAGIKVYSEDEVLLTDNQISGLVSHGTYTFKVTTVNNSGFENTADFIMLEDLEVENKLPTISINNTPSSFFSNNTVITYQVDDTDGDDLEIYSKIDGVSSTLSGPFPASGTTTLSSLINSTVLKGLTDGNDYVLQLGVKDSWDGGSGEVIYTDITFKYDNSNPVLESYTIEEIDGYSYYNGNLNFTVIDNDSGLKSVMYQYSDDEENWYDAQTYTINNDYTHYIPLKEGSYVVQVKATDNVDNINNNLLGLGESIQVDKNKPVVTRISSDDKTTGIIELSNVVLNVDVEWLDSFSNPSKVEYKFVKGGKIKYTSIKDVTGYSGLFSNGIDTLSDVITIDISNGASPLIEGEEYELYIRVYDSAGNIGDYVKADFDIIYDRTAPTLKVTDWQFVTNRGINYLTSEALKEPTITISDYVSSNITPTYMVAGDSLDEPIGPVSDITAIELSSDGDYTLYVFAEDRVGNQSVESIPFTRDTEAPEISDIKLVEYSKGSYSGGEDILISIEGTDASRYYYEVFDSLTGEVYSYSWVESSYASPYTLTLPRELDRDIYNVNLRVVGEDSAGNIARDNSGAYDFYTRSEAFRVNNTTETINVHIKPWIGTDGVLSATWEYYEGSEEDKNINSYTCIIYRERDGVISHEEPINTEDHFINYTIEDIRADDRYYVEVEGLLESSRSTGTFKSVHSSLDLVAPTITTLATDDYGRSDNIILGWDVDDNLKVANVFATLLWTYRDQDNNLTMVHGEKTELGSVLSGSVDLSFLLEGETIETGYSVYVDLEVVDVAGNTINQRSTAVKIDNTPPDDFEIFDFADFLNPSKDDSLFVDWSQSSDDADSPITEVYYQITTDGDVDNSDWIEFPLVVKESYINIHDKYQAESYNGALLQIVIKKVNAAGLSTFRYSDGVTLDSTAGKIIRAIFTENDGLEQKYYTKSNNVNIWIQGNDEESGVAKVEAELGYYEEGHWVTSNNGELVDFSVESNNLRVEAVLPFDENTDADKTFGYKLVWYNNANIPSENFYTRELVYYPGVPTITDLYAEVSGDKIRATWSSEYRVPFESGKINLIKVDGTNDEVILTEEIENDNRTYDISLANLTDGDYRVELTVSDVANGNSNVEVSDIFTLDRTAPVIETIDEDIFVSNTLNYIFSANESIAQYKFRIKPINSSSDWILAENVGSLINIESYDLTGISNYDSLHNSYLDFTVQFCDLYGNWSEEYKNIVKVDLTPPTTPVVSKSKDSSLGLLSDLFNFSVTSMDNILWESEDDISGLKSFEYIVYPEGSIYEDDSWTSVTFNNTDSFDLTIGNRSFNHGDEYKVAIRSLNGSGLYSDVGVSGTIFADLEAPSGRINDDSLIIDDSGDYLINGSQDITFSVDDDSDLVKATVSLYTPQGELLRVYDPVLLDSSKSSEFSQTIEPEEDNYGDYTIEIELVDAGYNSTIVTEVIRYNSPPYILQTPPDLVLNPMRPYELLGHDWFTDTDGLINIEYTIWDGDLDILSKEGLNSVEIALSHKNSSDSQTDYTIKVAAYDKYGAMTEETYPLTIVNTSYGSLYTDETWSGEHLITGSIIIPEDITLTVAGAAVTIETGPVSEEEHPGITINGTLTHTGEVSYSSTYDNWGGFMVNNSLIMSNVSISDANRGLIINTDETVIISDCEFDSNTIGVHTVTGSNVSIINSDFSNNLYYGIKEEEGTDPLVTGNNFSGNGYDYYDYDLSVINPEEINNLDNNTGNLGE